MANHLASELVRMQNIVRELEASMMDHDDLPPAAREICVELVSRVDRSLRIARSWSEGGRGDGGQPAPRTGVKRRKGVPSVRKQVRVTSVQDYAAATGDGFSWRKYGQKEILGAKYPRCTHRNTQACLATRHVQRADADPLLFDVVYHGAHTCGVQAGADDQLQPHQPAGHEQSSPRLMETGGGVLQAGFEPMMPHTFSSALAAAGADFFHHGTSFDWQLRSGGAAGGLGAAMEFDQQHFGGFFSSPPDSFRWDI